MQHYRNDPRWTTAKYAGRCRCGQLIHKGDTVFYYPGDRTILVGVCAVKASTDFACHALDEALAAVQAHL